MITLLHPSRGRANKAYSTFKKWIDNSSKTISIEHILSIDHDDNKKNEYASLFTDSIIVVNKNKNLIDASNIGARISKGDIIVLISDDFECYKNWDIDIENAYKDKKGFVLKTYDGIQQWIVTLPIMDREYYLSQGYFYYPEYKHMFCDTDMTHKAEVEGKLIIRNDLVFKHSHYSIGASEKDDVNRKADSTWNQGVETYLKRCKESFGVTGADIFKISNTNHINWLKTKIKC